MTVQDVVDKLDTHSPMEAALDWDNVGLLVGDATKEVGSVYVALDATDEVISHAIDCKADMLLTHHPLIFSGLKCITKDHFIGRRIMALVKNDISYVAFHTNFDVFGMGDAVADKLGLNDTTPLEVSYEDEGIGRIGNVSSEMTLRALAEDVKNKFELDAVNVYGNLDDTVRRVALCPGSGKSEIDLAVSKGADVIVTGDIGHHDGIDAVAKGIYVIDAGHYGLEYVFINYMADFLEGIGLKVYKEEITIPYTTI